MWYSIKQRQRNYNVASAINQTWMAAATRPQRAGNVDSTAIVVYDNDIIVEGNNVLEDFHLGS